MWKILLLSSVMIGCVHSGSELDEFSKIEKETGGRLGVAAYDIKSGDRMRYRAEELFPFCSTFKTMAVAAVLKAGLPDKTVTFSREDVAAAGYAPITTRFVETGMTLSELSAATIQYSDNAAVNILVRELGGLNEVNKFARAIGDKTFQLDRWEPDLNSAEPGDRRDTTSPEAMATSVEKILLGDALPAAEREKIVGWHRGNTTGDKRIRAGVPAGWIVGDKTGTCSWGTTNDVGVIWTPNGGAVVLAVYFQGKNKDAKANDEVIARVTKQIIGKFWSNKEL